MGRVREFLKDDIPEVTAFWQRVFRERAEPLPSDWVAAYFDEIFFGNLWRDEDLPSLVAEDDQRNLVGFLGVIPRRMTFQGKPIRVAVSTQFMVDPSLCPGFASIELLRGRRFHAFGRVYSGLL